VKYPDIKIDDFERAFEDKDNNSENIDSGFSHSLIENDKKTINEGRLLEAASSYGLNSFNPDLMLNALTEDYQNIENIYGETILRYLTGYDPSALKKNIKFPEFRNELKKKILKTIEDMKDENLLNDDCSISERGYELAALTLYMDELDDLTSKGLGEWKKKERSYYGEKNDIKNYKKGDRYKDLAAKQTIKISLRRQHNKILAEDLRMFSRESKGKIYIVYALDASGSMKGKKLQTCKKAGIGLAFKAINEMDRVGLMVFGSDVEDVLYPTDDFYLFLKKIIKVKAKKQTDLALTIDRSIDLFPNDNITKHLVLITDAIPTKGEHPEEKTLESVQKAVNSGITISLIGVCLGEGKELAKKIVELGRGKLSIVQNLEEMDKIVISDYYNLIC